MVVDDAIVVLENVTTHIERGTKPKSAAVFATSEVSLSVIATTLVLLAVFLPLTFLKGQAGILFKQLGWIVAIVCSVSTIAALSLTPMLCSLMLKSNPNRGRFFGTIYKPVEKFLNWLDRAYGAMLSWCVSHRIIVISTLFAVFIGSVALVKFIPTEFFPTQDMARMSVRVKLPIGTRVETSKDFAFAFVERMRKEFPEIIMMNFAVGQPDDDNAFGMMQENGTHILSFNIKLTKKTQRERSISEIADKFRSYLKEYPEIETYTVSTGGGGASGSVSFVLTYETNGGSEIKSESHKAGDEVTLDKTPTKDGATFTGWYADKECTQKIESVTMNSKIRDPVSILILRKLRRIQMLGTMRMMTTKLA